MSTHLGSGDDGLKDKQYPALDKQLDVPNPYYSEFRGASDQLEDSDSYQWKFPTSLPCHVLPIESLWCHSCMIYPPNITHPHSITNKLFK